MKKEKETPSYETAFAELQQLLVEMQSYEIGIDELAVKIERAKELIRFCRERLRAAEDVAGDLLGD